MSILFKKWTRFRVVIVDPWALPVENVFYKDKHTFIGLLRNDSPF